MKTIAISSFFVLFAIVAGLVATTPDAFADHSEVTVVPAPGSSSPGCETTAEGCYIPKEATVDVGGVVIFSNTDSAAHTFTAGTAADGPSGAFDSSLAIAGSSYEWKPTEVGSFPYYCMVHPWMEGLIVVQEAGAEKHDEGMTDESMSGDTMMKDVSATGMLSDGTKVSVSTSAPTTGEKMKVNVEFAGKEHVNHDIMVTQNGEDVLNDMAAHHHDGKGVHETAPLKSSDPVEITITFQGYGVDDPKTGPIGEKVVFSNVVPEFGTIAMMILAVSIISIVAVTAKSKVIPRF
ncbi:PEFG-CTERM sorting domain-containing protein [Candidatus Nitrosarchaeum limnium]|jgi:predicted secreted protein with PEFG-CTERM motif|uniref:Copper binding protein, plastocyanin/azurin family n=1 Tax=Candidatus Nitrosarchaeum limnium BG20 TaxID=859192 RepID=S2EBQ0_9ARCH|nr:PEFG-CTERM sorting domain-containing protein [Candidatus Nitrosarchaeum limnium]EPA06776.1 copper binding protein, plastocyanin/azurin family [Candidatus Nitrosarchaeum limnium BG20]